MTVIGSSTERGWVGVELRHLTTLVAIARTKSFGAAAQSLGYTQSAISAQVASLERAVGVQLISRARGSRFVRLTDDGEILLAHAEAVTNELERARARVGDRLSGESATAIRLNAPRSLAPVLPPLLKLVRHEAPSVNVLIRETDEHRVTAPLEHPSTHLWLTTLTPLGAARLEGVRIGLDPFVLVTPELADASMPNVDWLASVPLAAPSSGVAARRIDELFSRTRASPSFVMRTDDASALNAVARQRIAVAIMPRLLVESDLRSTARSLDHLLEPREISVGWPAGRDLPSTARLVVAAASRVAAAWTDG